MWASLYHFCSMYIYISEQRGLSLRAVRVDEATRELLDLHSCGELM